MIDIDTALYVQYKYLLAIIYSEVRPERDHQQGGCLAAADDGHVARVPQMTGPAFGRGCIM